jgi:hypothetical protein
MEKIYGELSECVRLMTLHANMLHVLLHVEVVDLS